MLTDVMSVMKETMSFDFDLREHEDNDNVTSILRQHVKLMLLLRKVLNQLISWINYDAGWLSPDGVYYGLRGEISNMLHIQIADALQEKGIVPSKPEGEVGVELNAMEWLETHGWIKIHGNNVHYDGLQQLSEGQKEC